MIVCPKMKILIHALFNKNRDLLYFCYASWKFKTKKIATWFYLCQNNHLALRIEIITELLTQRKLILDIYNISCQWVSCIFQFKLFLIPDIDIDHGYMIVWLCKIGLNNSELSISTQ